MKQLFVLMLLPAITAFAQGDGGDVYQEGSLHVRFEADGGNLNNRLNVIYFGGLFSGNSIGPARNFGLRLVTNF